MAWIVFWESVSGGYRVRNSHGELVAEISNAAEGAERHAAALERIEELEFENADLERTYNAAADDLVKSRELIDTLEQRLANAEAGLERQLVISDAAQKRIAELEEQANGSPG